MRAMLLRVARWAWAGRESADFLAECLALAQTLVVQLGLEAEGYRVIVNGGAHQDVGQLHVHLVSGAVREIGLR